MTVKVGGDRLILYYLEGHRVEGIARIYYDGLRNIVISPHAVSRFFEKYGYEKAAYELLKLQKEVLEEEVARLRTLIRAGYDIQSFRDDLTEAEADLRLVEELLHELEVRV